VGEPLKRSVGCLVSDMERNSIPADRDPANPLKIWKAILAGWLVVNVPVVIIMLTVLLIGMAIERNAWWLFLTIAFFLGWTWWSFIIPRWRRWAVSRGAPADRLQRWAVISGLVWRKGSAFEKTELHLDK